jgi:Cu/Zn superoxide dismutase
MKRPIILAAILAVALVASAQAIPGALVARAELGPYTTAHAGVVTDAGVTAQAHILTTPRGEAILRVSAAGLASGELYGVHIHYGACTDYLGHYQYQHPGPSTRDNEVWLDLTANEAGRAVDQVQVAAIDLHQPLSLVIHQHSNPDVESGAGHPGPRIACGNLELIR